MKIYVYFLIMMLSCIHFAVADDNSAVYEITPLHTDEINRFSLYGAEIGNGAVLGADSIFCENKDDYEGCYLSIQRILARAKREAEKLASMEEYTSARYSLVFALRESAKNLAINYSINGGQLLDYLTRGLEYNKQFLGLCVDEKNSVPCFRDEAKAAYSFLNSYYSVILDNTYLLDLQFLVPMNRKACGYEPASTKPFEEQLENYAREQSQMLRIVLGVPVNNERSAVTFYNAYYEAKVVSKIFEYVSTDLQTNELGPFFNISVSSLVGLSEEIKRSLRTITSADVDLSSFTSDAKRIAAQVVIDLEGNKKYRRGELSKINCNIRDSN